MPAGRRTPACFLWACGLGAALAATLPAQVRLDELPALARARAERQRPAQEKAMEPFWADLALDYRNNREFLDGRIEQVARLGDSVVPLLLEKLTPADGSSQSRNLAENCARVLALMDPSTFVDALLELAQGDDPVARSQALVLLGHTGSPRAGQALVDLLPRLTEPDLLRALASLARLRYRPAAPRVVEFLGSKERQVRRRALEYLVQAQPPEVIDTVLQALSAESDNRLLPRYIAYLGAVAKGSAEVAEALLPLLQGQRLDWEDTRRLVEVLATVAPEGHEPTVEALRAMLEGGETGALGLQAALTLQALGDRSGMTRLHRSLSDLLRRPSHRKDAALYAQRADLYFAAGQWTEAQSDYEKAHSYTRNSLLATRALLMIARCEAHRRRWSMVLRRLKEAQADYETVLRLAREDPAMQEALQQEKIRSWLNELPRDKDGD